MTTESKSIDMDTTLKQIECLEHGELKSCDRCLRNCSRIYWSSSTRHSPKLIDSKASKSAILSKFGDDQKPGTSADYFLTAGQLLETGPSGNSVFELSKQIAKAPSLAPKRRHQVFNQSWNAVQLIDGELETLRTVLLPLLIQKIDSRQQGVLQGSSDEFKNAVTLISKKYRDRRAEMNSNCFSQMENLRRQLKADVEFQEKLATQKTNEALTRRLKEVDEKLKQLGCTGPDFSMPATEVNVHPSTLCRIEFEDKFATCVLPVPHRLSKTVKEYEKEELQNFLMYSKLESRPINGDEPASKRKHFKIEQVAANVDGLIDADNSDDND